MAAGAWQEWSYRGVRFFHLALSAALIPAGLAHYLLKSPGGALIVLALTWFLAILVLLFALPMDQNRYPIGLAAALWRTGPVLINVGAGIYFQKDLWRGAFFGATSLVAGLALFLTVGAVIELGGKAPAQDEVDGQERRRLAERLLLPMAVLAWAAVAAMWPMLWRESQTGKAMLALWGFQALSTTQFWFGQSTWVRSERDARTDLFESSWSGPTAAFFTAGFLAVTVVAIWLGLAR